MWASDMFVFQARGVRLVVVAIGPDARKPKYRKVLRRIGGENVFSVHDYRELDETVRNITNLICRKFIIYFAYFILLYLTLPLGHREMQNCTERY